MKRYLIMVSVLHISVFLGALCAAQAPRSLEDQTPKVCSKIEDEKVPSKAERSKTPSVACKGRHSVRLSWKASGSLPVPHGEGEGYIVYRWKIGGLCQKVQPQIIEDTAYEDCSVEAGQTYRYSVTAVKKNRESDPSNVVEALVPQP